jgi:hypothetical protein
MKMKRVLIIKIFVVTCRRNKSYKFLEIKYEGAYLYFQINFVTGVRPAKWPEAEMIPADLIRIMPAKGG